MKYFLIAGEASGDLHASMLIDAIKKTDESSQFQFLGGDLMQEKTGIAPNVHYKNMAYMGFIEVIKHLREIFDIMKDTKEHIASWKPDALILIDYPSFNLKIAKYAKSLDIPVFYYISPKVWAWKEYRVKEIKRNVTKLYSILPFEPDFYHKHDYAVEYVGNPSVAEIDEALLSIPNFDEFCNKHSLESSKPIIALVPGSRTKEIQNNLSEMLKAAYEFPDYQVVIAGAPGIDIDFYSKVIKTEGSYKIPKIVVDDTFALVRNSCAALVTSGTATLETALLNTPQVACFRMSGSRLVYEIFAHILKVKYVTLPNLICNSPIISEKLLHHCNCKEIAKTLSPLLIDSPKRDEMLSNYASMRKILGTQKCAEVAADSIKEILQKNKK